MKQLMPIYAVADSVWRQRIVRTQARTSLSVALVAKLPVSPQGGGIMGRSRRWRWLGALLTTLGSITGCTQHHFMTEGDYRSLHSEALCGKTGPLCDDPADINRMPIVGQPRTVL